MSSELSIADDGSVMTLTEAHEAAVALTGVATSGGDPESAQWAAWLGARTGREWLLLDDASRSWRPSGQAPVSGARGWLGERLDEPSGFVAAVTSWHVDGRIRQRATKVLAARGGQLAAAALAVRCFDHVPQVRADAISGLRRCTSPEEAAAVFGVLAAGQRRQFAAETLVQYSDVLARRGDLASILAEARQADEPGLRRWAFTHSASQGLIDVDELVGTALRGPDQFVRAAAATALCGQRTSTSQLLALLEGRFVDGRLLAVQELPDEVLGDGALLSLLADRSGRLRELAQWRARRRGHDLATWYRARLREGALGPSALAACLDGLSTVGGAEDVDLAASFIGYDSPAVRAQAVLTVAAVASSDVARRMLLPLLLDPAPRVSAAAARAVGRAGAGASDAEPAWVSSLPASRRAGWRLSRAAGAWDRVDADVRAASDPDPVLAGLGRAGLRNWLKAGAATTWGRPSNATAERLQAWLPGAGLSEDEQRQVRFHAGLPAPAGASRPEDDDPDAPRLRRGLRLLRRR